uniref:Cyclin N-terminal domain-containing protein n=1 Tax=Meloidogyne incognita TaxID=6306 RepID=A0A914KI23_MELIC
MYKEVAAACLFLASKSEECPRKLEHVVEVWFRLKFRKAEVQPPFNEAVSYLMKKNLAYTLHLFYA